MRACILTGSYPAYKGHLQSPFVYALTKALADKKVNIEVVCPFYKEIKKKNEVLDNIKVHRFQYFWPLNLQKLTTKGGIPTNLRKSFFAKLQLPFFSLSMLLKGLKVSRKCDIIHTQWSLAGLVGVFIKRINKKKLIVTVRGSDVKTGLRNKLFKKILKFVFKNADKITTVSEDLRDDIIQLGINKNKIIMIPNGVDSNIFKKRDKKIIRKKLAIDFNKKIILFVGHLIKEKGVGYLINAMSYLKDSQLLLIGEGADENIFKNQSSKLKNILFLGTKSQEELAHYYNAADVFVLPSFSEGRPNTVLEAMASETAIIATDVGGIPELINNKTGLLIKPKNTPDIVNSVNKLLNNKKLREKLGKNARKFITNNKLNWQGCADKYIKEYKALK